MARVDVDASALHVRFTRGEKIAGLLRDLSVQLDSIDDVSVEVDGLVAAAGIRAPGLAIPGRRKIGTWRARGRRMAVCVRRGEPALRARLRGHRYTELLIGTPEAQRVVVALAERVERDVR
jgi:hypothetical protein